MSPSAARTPRPEAEQKPTPTPRTDELGYSALRFDAHVTACFSVVARAEPGVMPRVMELFAKRGLVPSSWHSATSDRAGLDGENGGELTIDIQMRGLALETADFIAARLRRLADVEIVLTSQKR